MIFLFTLLLESLNLYGRKVRFFAAAVLQISGQQYLPEQTYFRDLPPGQNM